jgi:type VI secretion system protein ImpK
LSPGEHVAEAAAPGLNPLVQAAGPTLILAGHLRGTLSGPDPASLRRMALDEVRRFEDRARTAGVSPDAVLAARYVLCAALDEAVLSTPWGAQSEWSQQTLLVALHKEAWGGEKFFEILDRLGQDPARHVDLMELQYLCVAFGFAGKYHVNERGRAQLADVQRAVYRKIRDQRGTPHTELSLRWEGVTDRRNPLLRYVPWWVAAAALIGIVLVVYFWYFRSLLNLAEPVEVAIEKAGTERAASRAVPQGPNRLVPLLKGVPQIEVIEEGAATRIRLTAPSLFASGLATLDEKYEALLDPVAQAVKQVPGQLTVEGHTDNQRLSASSGFENNVHLSRARAQSVVDALIKRGVDGRRLTISGLGSSQPVPNEPPSSPKNRRVEIVHVP